MTDKAHEPSASAGPPPAADPQDPLPEGTFLYRRIFSYGVAVAIIALLALVVWRIEGDADLRRVATSLCWLLFVTVTYYMVAPSAEQVVKMMQTAKLFLGGVKVRQEAEAENDAGRAAATTVVEKPAEPEPVDAAPTSRR